MDKDGVIGVVAKNSLAYVKTMFDAYEDMTTVVLLRSLDDNSRIELTGVTSTIEPEDNFGWFSSAYEFNDADSLAQISFTSGTEGDPKGVLLTHKALSDVTHRLNNIMETDSSIREYVGVPAHFSFGLGRFRAVAAIGGAAFLPEAGFNPIEIRDMLEKEEINALSAVPTLWRVLLKNKSIFGSEALNLKWIEIGSQYMSRKEKEELKSLFPKAIIVQHYGLTEASRTTFLRIDQLVGDALESVGTAVGQTEIKVSKSDRICIRGHHVANTLLKQGEYTSNVDEFGWFETNDLGRIQDGYLYYLGRADDLINCSGIKLSPDALERDLREHLKIKEGIAIASYDDDLIGNGVLVAQKTSLDIEQQVIFTAMTDILLNYGINNKSVVKIIVLDDYPITSTGKVQRKELSKAYELKYGNGHNNDVGFFEDKQNLAGNDAPPTCGNLSDEEKFVRSIWQQVLNVEGIDIDSNFYRLGGDSLTAISAVLEMEKMGNVPSEVSKGMLQGLTIREISAQLIDSEHDKNHKHRINTPEMKTGMSINIIRGFLVLFVIFAHWSAGILERLPESVSNVWMYLGPMFSMGTPGFSIIYGVGAGYALFSIYQSDPKRLKKILRKTVFLLLWGILILGMLIFLRKYITYASVTFTDFTNSFYSVLTYYLLISLTLYFWFKVLSFSRFPVVISSLLAIIFYSIHTFGIKAFGLYDAEGVVEFIKLLLTAKYAYFLMLSGTMIGISIGIYTRQLINNRESLGVYAITGLIAIILGAVVSVHAGDSASWLSWPIKYNYIWRWIFYAGVILVMLSFIDHILDSYNECGPKTQFVIQFFSVIGILAFPLFITHGMVLPIKSILSSYGMGSFSLIFPLTLFLISGYVMFRKMYRINFL